MNALRTLTFLAIALLSHAAFAQSTDIPCSACPAPRRPPLPESGFWHNPLQPGSGFNLEVQNRRLAGTHVGYTESGEPTWFIFEGALVHAADTGVAWTATAQRYQLSRGSCVGCEYSPPESNQLDSIRFEFLQRGLARFKIGDGAWSVIHAFTFGVETTAIGNDVVYPMAQLGSGTWVLVFQDVGAQGEQASRRAFVTSTSSGVDLESPQGRAHGFFVSENGSEAIGVGGLKCSVIGDGSPACSYTAESTWSRFTNAPQKVFLMPLGNITDSRFKGEAADGETVEGVRISYD